jgi:putative CocE/NonD family hydrolase
LIIGIITALAVVLAGTLYFVVFRSSDDSEPAIASDTHPTISVDGVDLAAEVITPRGPAHPPLVVIPGSFGDAGGPKNFHEVSLLFARAGYQVVAYGQRGFGGSTGKIDFAGPATQKDAREVITWALDHTHADPKRVAMFGTSYGGGVSLLTAAHDPRVRVVAALSTWTDFAESYTSIGTPHTNALRSIIGNTDAASDYNPDLRHLQNTLLDRPADLAPLLRRMSPVRSPASYVKQLNKNKPAIMIANAFEDSYFGPSQLIPFFDRLHTPKRLELAPGDHGGPERSALSGTTNDVLNDVRAWFDHYLRGAPNGINKEEPIVVKDVRTGELHPYRSWPEATKRDHTDLAKPTSGASPDVSTVTTWTSTIRANTDSGANSGPIQLVPSPSYQPPRIKMSALAPNTCLVWGGPVVTNGLNLTGTPTVTLNVAATKPTATLFLYLYDVTSDGSGSLVDLQPYTATGLTAQATKQVSIAMQPTSWSVPAGDRLVLVLDTADPHYQSLTPPGTTITVTSNKKDTAAFSVPASV